MKLFKIILFLIFASSAVVGAEEIRYPIYEHRSNKTLILSNFANNMRNFLKSVENNGTKAEDITIVIVTAENDSDFQNKILEEAKLYFPTIKFKFDKVTNKYSGKEYDEIDLLQYKYLRSSIDMNYGTFDMDTYTNNLNQLSKLIDQYTELVNNYLISSGKNNLENFSYNTDIDNLILTNKIFTFNNEILDIRLRLFFSGIKGINIDEKSSFNQDNLNLLFEVFNKLNSLKNIVTSKAFNFIENDLIPEFEYYQDRFRTKPDGAAKTEAQISKDVSKLLAAKNSDEFIVKTKVYINNPVKTLNIDEISLVLNELEKLNNRAGTAVPSDVLKCLAFRVEEIITNKGQVPIAGSKYVEAFYKRREAYLTMEIGTEKSLFKIVEDKINEAKRIKKTARKRG